MLSFAGKALKALTYLRAGLLLHAITLLEIVILSKAGPGCFPAAGDSWPQIVCKGVLLVFLASLPVLSQLDARCRYQNYKRVRDQFRRHGFDPRILRPLMKSRCQRDAAGLAARKSGHGKACRAFFRSCGYRWYHVLPDFLFTRPGFLISRHFWKSTFFLKAYRR